jgi:hypothetical protein
MRILRQEKMNGRSLAVFGGAVKFPTRKTKRVHAEPGRGEGRRTKGEGRGAKKRQRHGRGGDTCPNGAAPLAQGCSPQASYPGMNAAEQFPYPNGVAPICVVRA